STHGLPLRAFAHVTCPIWLHLASEWPWKPPITVWHRVLLGLRDEYTVPVGGRRRMPESLNALRVRINQPQQSKFLAVWTAGKCRFQSTVPILLAIAKAELRPMILQKLELATLRDVCAPDDRIDDVGFGLSLYSNRIDLEQRKLPRHLSGGSGP